MNKMKSHRKNKGYQEIIHCGQGSDLKQTLICPICAYTSRVTIRDSFGGFNPKTHDSSIYCPTHRILLQSLGSKTRIPRRKSKKFRKFMKK